MLGLNGTTASVGWIGAAALGAAMPGRVGFEGFGPRAVFPAFARRRPRALQPPESVMSDTTPLVRAAEFGTWWWSFRHSPLTIAAAIVTLLFFLGAIFAPWVVLFDPLLTPSCST